MPSGTPGSTVVLSAHFRTAADELVDPATPRVDIFDPAGDEVITDAVPVQVVTGIYTYSFAIPVDASLGDWVIHWTGTIGSDLASSDETFTVTTASSSSAPSEPSVFTVHQGDLLPIISSVLRGPDGAPLNLNGTVVMFRMRLLSSQDLKVDAVATIGDADNGVVSYPWQTGDTDTAGVMLAEWQVTYPGPKVLTIPNDVPIVVVASPLLTDIPVLSPNDLASIRAIVGPTPGDTELAVALARLATPEAVALEVLETRLAVMLSMPVKYDIDGDVSIDNTKAIDALAAKCETLRGTVTAVAAAVPIPWAGGLTWSERENPDPDLVPPYFTETGTLTGWDARAG